MSEGYDVFFPGWETTTKAAYYDKYWALLRDLESLAARANTHREYPVYPSELAELVAKHKPAP